MFERPFMCLWPYNGISLSFSSIWFISFGPSGNSWKKYFAQVRSCGSACSLAWFKPTFGVERASQGFFSRCDFETFQIKPVDPLIACVAWRFFVSDYLVVFFLFFFLGFDESRKLQLEVWRNHVFFGNHYQGIVITFWFSVSIRYHFGEGLFTSKAYVPKIFRVFFF